LTRINAYLTFNGNCREAMTFYKECLGGELNMMSVGESPVAAQLPASARHHIMHAALTRGDIALMASDMMGSGELVRGNGITLMLNCSSAEEINTFFNRLSAGGKVTTPVKEEFWGSLYGDLTDKFGVRWMLNFDKPK
jgi:PhnB protein